MKKFSVDDIVTPVVAPGFPEIHPDVSEGSKYVILRAEESYVEIVDDLCVKSWWSNAWFKKSEPEKITTAESLRNRFLEIEKEEEEISKKIDALSEEKSKIEDDLRAMGFMLCSPVIKEFIPILDNSPEIDYSDWRNWKKGYMVECVNDKGWEGSFVSGGLYEVISTSENCIWIMGEAGRSEATYYGSDFKFHSPF